MRPRDGPVAVTDSVNCQRASDEEYVKDGEISPLWESAFDIAQDKTDNSREDSS
jgi:hypothetical protein